VLYIALVAGVNHGNNNHWHSKYKVQELHRFLKVNNAWYLFYGKEIV
jgi:hypothetical protein